MFVVSIVIPTWGRGQMFLGGVDLLCCDNLTCLSFSCKTSDHVEIGFLSAVVLYFDCTSIM